jgi:hypothetical protein
VNLEPPLFVLLMTCFSILCLKKKNSFPFAMWRKFAPLNSVMELNIGRCQHCLLLFFALDSFNRIFFLKNSVFQNTESVATQRLIGRNGIRVASLDVIDAESD